MLSMGDMISSCLLVLFLLSSPLTFLHLSNTVSSQSLQILSMHLRILFARWEASHCHNFSESSFLGPAIFSKVTKAFSQYVENVNFLLGVNDFPFLHPYSFLFPITLLSLYINRLKHWYTCKKIRINSLHHCREILLVYFLNFNCSKL